jgi:Ankyrin repeats (many copies)
MLLDAGADPNRPWTRWDVGRQPAGVGRTLRAPCRLPAARRPRRDGGSGWRRRRGAGGRSGESVHLPAAPPPAMGLPAAHDYGWILGQFAALGQTAVVQALLDDGMPVDTRGWSNFTPLDQAAMHGRTDTVRLLIDRGADLYDCAFDEDGPTPLDCALWGLHNNHADDGDHPGTVQALLAAGAPTRQSPPTGDETIDALLARTRRD